MSLYIVYLTWSAMSNQPDPKCKADLEQVITGEFSNKDATKVLANMVRVHKTTPTMDTASIFGLILWFLCVLYSSIRTSTNDQAARYVYKKKNTKLKMIYFLISIQVDHV